MEIDILEQLVDHLKITPFKISIQLDETKDVTNCSQLIALVRYFHNGNIKEDFLFCEELETTTTAKDVFRLLFGFFQKNNLDINIIGSVCTDGAAAMLGCKSGLVALLKQQIPRLQSTHCFLHRYALISKTLPVNLKHGHDISVKIINLIKNQPLNCRLFKALCSEYESKFTNLLYHTEVRWLSRGNVLTRFFNLLKEVKIFLNDKKSILLVEICSKEFEQRLAYTSDIFSHMNDVSILLQGRNINILYCKEKLNAFKEKLSLWKRQIENSNYSRFPNLRSVIGTDNQCKLSTDVVIEITAHLEDLSKSFDKYFSMGNLETHDEWIINSYDFDLNLMPDECELKEQLIELRLCCLLKIQYYNEKLENYWCAVFMLFPELGGKALTVFISFETTYLCESKFSTLLLIKSKHRNRLDVQCDIRFALSSISPRIDIITNSKQEQKSH